VDSDGNVTTTFVKGEENNDYSSP